MAKKQKTIFGKPVVYLNADENEEKAQDEKPRLGLQIARDWNVMNWHCELCGCRLTGKYVEIVTLQKGEHGLEANRDLRICLDCSKKRKKRHPDN